jgi:hypothetical protein
MERERVIPFIILLFKCDTCCGVLIAYSIRMTPCCWPRPWQDGYSAAVVLAPKHLERAQPQNTGRQNTGRRYFAVALVLGVVSKGMHTKWRVKVADPAPEGGLVVQEKERSGSDRTSSLNRE